MSARDPLTTDALVEAVARALCRERRDCTPHLCDVSPDGGCLPAACWLWSIHKNAARAALAAVAKASGFDAEAFRVAAYGYDDDPFIPEHEVFAAWLRALAGAVP